MYNGTGQLIFTKHVFGYIFDIFRDVVPQTGHEPAEYYQGRLQRQRRETDSGLTEQPVRAERTVRPQLWGRKLFHMPGISQSGQRHGADRT
jgi:hypothetical protein